MSEAKVTMPLDEFNSINKLLDETTKRAEQLTKELYEARATDQTGRVPRLAQLTRSAMHIVGFAMGNLSPELIKRWPYAQLREIAAFLPTLPDYSSIDEEIAAELIKFAAECEEWEQKRKRYGEVEVPPPFPVEDHPLAQLLQGRMPKQAIDGKPGAEIKTDPSAS